MTDEINPSELGAFTNNLPNKEGIKKLCEKVNSGSGGVEYTAGDNIQISAENVISATDTKYTAGTNVEISEQNVISATDTKYTAGTGISISEQNVISASGGSSYTAGRCIDITNDKISLKDFTYVSNLSGVLTKSNGTFTVNKDMIIEVIYNQGTGFFNGLFFFPKGYSISLGSFTFARYPISVIDGNKTYNYISIYCNNVPETVDGQVSYSRSGYTFTTDGTTITITSAYDTVNTVYNNIIRAYVRN